MATTVGTLQRSLFREGWWRDRGWLVTIAVGIFAIGFILWLLLGWGGPDHRTLIADVAFIPMGLALTAMAWRAGRHHAIRAKTRRAWMMVGLAAFCWWLGDVLWSYYEVGLGQAPFPSPADAAYLMFYPILLIGLLSFPSAPQERVVRATFWLDAATVLLSGWMIVWYFVLGPTALEQHADLLTIVLSSAYPIGDLVIIFGIAWVLLRRPEEGSRQALGLLAAGVASFLIADLAFGHLSLSDAYKSGDWPDAFWMVALFLMVCSAQWQVWSTGRQRHEEPRAEAEVGSASTLPYLAVALGYAMLFFAGRHAAAYPIGGLLSGAIAITAVVLARQLTVMNENIRLLGKLHELATTDSLTGSMTRRHFFDLAHREFSRAKRYSRKLSAIMIDVDFFKAINDRYGHASGDEALQAIVTRCRANLREIDFLGRYGGDELVILMPEVDLRDATRAAERVLAAVAETPLVTNGSRIDLSVSAGVASVEDSTDLATMLRRADVALYEAKQAGRNCIRTAATDSRV
ncbi:MAG TPA: GGDEF domain-containing protein [bacterium]|nr:GGDEF domain-containing protein [bacterium]